LLVGGDGPQLAISFSADGSAMAYMSDTTGRFEVLGEPFPPDGSRTRLSEVGTDSAWPVWSRSGSRLTYQITTGGFMAVDVVTPGFAIRNRRALAGSGNPNQRRIDSMPDGEHMFMTVQSAVSVTGADGGTGSTEIVIVENWIEEVKARVPGL
jgi:WD40-like Beta Propeller Repeat